MSSDRQRWLACTAGTVLLFVTGGIAVNTFTVFLPYIIERCALTNTEASLITTARCAFSMLATPFVNRLYNSAGIRKGAECAVLSCMLSFLAFSFCRGAAGFIAAAALSGIGYGLGGMVAATIIINRFFTAGRGKAMGICLSGTAAAAIILPPPLTALIEKIGVGAAFLSEAALIALAGILIFICLKDEYPDDYAATQTCDPVRDSPLKGGEILPSGILTMMIAAVFCTGAIGSCAAANVSAHFSPFGYDKMVIAEGLSIYGIILLVSKFIFGALADRFETEKVNYLFFAAMIGGIVLCLFAYTKSNLVFFASQVLMGFGFSVLTVGMPVWAGDMATDDNQAILMQKYQLAYYIGGLSCSVLPGILADLTGNYTCAYALFTLLGVLLALLVQMSYWRFYNGKRG